VPQHIRRRRARLAVAIVLLLAVTIGAVGWWLGSGRWTDVPSLAGKSREAAVDMLQDAGLDPKPVVLEFSETVPAGTVISTDPSGGEAIRGTDVKVVVSKGAERFVVDADVVGRPADEVEAELQENLPVQIARAEVYDDTIAAGSVVTFDPPPGTPLTRDQVVTMQVSKGHSPVAVPDVTGQAPEQAVANLEALGFTVERRRAIVGERSGAINHLALVVATDDGPYVADGGLGEGLLDPLPLRPGRVTAGAFHADLERDDGGWWVQYAHGAGVRIHDEPVPLSAFARPHRRLSTSPESGFVRTLVVQQPHADRIATLRARTYTEKGPDVDHRELVADVAAFATVLRERFGIDPEVLGPGRMAKLWERACAQHEAFSAQPVGAPPPS
jgi:hypothetical protein